MKLTMTQRMLRCNRAGITRRSPRAVLEVLLWAQARVAPESRWLAGWLPTAGLELGADGLPVDVDGSAVPGINANRAVEWACLALGRPASDYGAAMRDLAAAGARVAAGTRWGRFVEAARERLAGRPNYECEAMVVALVNEHAGHAGVLRMFDQAVGLQETRLRHGRDTGVRTRRQRAA